MSLTQNEKICQVSETTLVVGVDIASEMQHARAFDFRGREVGKIFKFHSDLAGFTEFTDWIEKIKVQTGKTDVIIGAEPTAEYWFTLAECLKEKRLKFVFVSPMHVKRTKELDDNHPGKNDRKDPKTIAKLVIEGRYLEPYIPEDVYAELRVMNNNRMRVLKELNSIKNRITRWFVIYFPEYKKVFADWGSESSIILLQNAPMPSDVLTLDAENINKLWRERKLRAVGMKRAKAICDMAQISVGVSTGENAARYEIKALLEDYLRKSEQLKTILAILETLIIQVPHTEKLMSIHGVGMITVVSFVAEVGDIRRFKSPKQIQKLAGYAIRDNSSGKHRGQTTISKRGRKRLRQALFQVVLPLIRTNGEFKDLHRYYTTRQKNALKGKQSVVVLACKLIRVFWVILTKGVDYSSEKFVSDIVREPLAA